jgi:hypothetical protein
MRRSPCATSRKVDPGKAEAVFFVTNDCPISIYYAHEIRHICHG